MRRISDSDTIIAYSSLGYIYSEAGDLDSGSLFYQEVINVRKKLKDTDGLALAYNNLGDIELIKKDYKKAQKLFLNAHAIWLNKLGGTHPKIATVRMNLGECARKMNKKSIALEWLDSALVANRYIEGEIDTTLSIFVLNNTFYQIGATYLAIYKKTFDKSALYAAWRAFQKAAEGIRIQRMNQQEGKLKNKAAEKLFPVYEGLVSTAYYLYLLTDSSDYAFNAFASAETAKSRLLFETMKKSNALHFGGIPAKFLQKERKLRQDIADHQGWLSDSESKKDEHNKQLIDEVRNSLFSLQQSMDSLIHFIEYNFPNYYKLKYNLSTITIPQLQQTLYPRQALLEYFVGDDSIYLFAIRSDSFRVVSIPKDFPLKDCIEEMRAGIKETDASASLKYVDAALYLYEKIFAPVQDFLPQGTQLVIVPDGELGYIPFDALLYESPKDLSVFPTYSFLMKKYPISYCYSATLLQEMQQKHHERTPSKNFLGIAPYFSGEPYHFKSVAMDTLQPLEYNVKEVKGIKRLIGGHVQTSGGATEQSFTESAGDYRILHLSTHGKANDQVGDYSYLAFTEIPDSTENEFLFNRELYNLRLNADMVVLSACETGIGELQRGEGIISLARGFSYAGAKSIVTTLWSIREEPTKTLLNSFYGNLQKGMSKDSALWQAKLKSLEGQAPEPYYWAAFIPIGDMQPIPLESGGLPWWVWAVAVGTILFAAALWWYRRTA